MKYNNNEYDSSENMIYNDNNDNDSPWPKIMNVIIIMNMIIMKYDNNEK